MTMPDPSGSDVLAPEPPAPDRQVPDRQAPLVAVAPAAVGYVEAATDTRILGWAWAPAWPQRRLVVQALLGDAVVAEALADHLRDDLARNGIGDGRHAFELAVPETARSRLTELRVVARAEDGAMVPLGAPAPPEGTAERLDRLQRSVDLLIGSQRLLHRNLQATMVSPTHAAPQRNLAEDGEIAAALQVLATTQADLGRQLATLELFAMRLDERLVALSPAVAAVPSRSSRTSRIALVLSAVAVAVSAWGLLHAVWGAVGG